MVKIKVIFFIRLKAGYKLIIEGVNLNFEISLQFT